MLTRMEYYQDIKSAAAESLIANHQPMIITSSYKGIILTQPVQVCNILPGRVIFQAPEPVLSFTLKEKIILYSPAFWETLTARLLSINTVLGKMELSDLTFTTRIWNDRQDDRVQPRDPIYVYGELNNEPIRANLDDLSMGGMNLMVNAHKGKLLALKHDSSVRLTMQLSGDDTRLDVKGKVIHSRKVGMLVFVGVQLTVSSAQEKRIYRYVMARKAEILAELERNFQEVHEHRWMASTYF